MSKTKRGVPTHSLKWARAKSNRLIHVEREAATRLRVNPPTVLSGDITAEDEHLAAFSEIISHNYTSSLLCSSATLPTSVMPTLLFIGTRKAQKCRLMGFQVSFERTAHSRVPGGGCNTPDDFLVQS